MKSHSEPWAAWEIRTALTVNGASGQVDGSWDDEPMWMHSTLFVSWQAWYTGSQYPSRLQIDGRPSGWGFSGKLTATAPLSAQRRISSAAAAGSHSGMRVAPKR